MTVDEFYDQFVAILEKRLEENPSPALSARLLEFKSLGALALPDFGQQLLWDIPPAPAAPVGSCVYSVGGRSFCADNVTFGECANVSGTFNQGGVCPIETPWPTPGTSSPSGLHSPDSGSPPPGPG
jgi:hypothetical protein